MYKVQAARQESKLKHLKKATRAHPGKSLGGRAGLTLFKTCEISLMKRHKNCEYCPVSLLIVMNSGSQLSTL